MKIIAVIDIFQKIIDKSIILIKSPKSPIVMSRQTAWLRSIIFNNKIREEEKWEELRN